MKPLKFTLIELLVVIAIIAILASMLLPTLNRSRESSNKIDCVSRLSQCMKGQILYAADYDDHYYIFVDDNSLESYWGRKLVDCGYISREVAGCPTSKLTPEIWQNITYGIFRFDFGGDGSNPRGPFTRDYLDTLGDYCVRTTAGSSEGFYMLPNRMKRSSKAPVFADCRKLNGEGYMFFNPRFFHPNAATALAHNEQANIAYGDGRVESMNLPKLREDGFTKFVKDDRNID